MMKRFFFSLFALFLFSQVGAQQNNGTDGNGFYLQLFLPDGSKPLFASGNGGYGGAQQGGSVYAEMEGEIVWSRTAAGDSLGCDTAINDLTGKFALVRRGFCEFGDKAYHAELAGAKAVLILNHYNSAWEDENTVITMAAGLFPKASVPFIFVCRKVGELITNAIDNGQPLKARFVFRSLDKATAAYHFATPLSQVDTLKHITAHFRNPSADTIFGATVNASITEPGGNVVTLSVPVAELLPGQDTLLFFPPYLPPSTLGDFEVVFSNTAFGEVEDLVKRKFQVTQKAWATDNLEILPEGIPVEWDISLFHFQPGAVYRTGSVMDTARQIFFGLKNANQIFNPAHPEYNIISGVIYDADKDDDDKIDFEGGWQNLNDIGAIVGLGVYTLTGNESPDSLLALPIVFWNEPTKALVLKPRHWYYVSFIYDGPDVAKFFVTPKEYYFNFPSSPTQIGNVMVEEGFVDLTVVQRLGNENFANPSAAPNLLSPSKFALSPNPANNFFQLNLSLSAANKKIAASLHDWQGRAVVSEKRTDFQEGSISFEVKNLPSGAYLLWLRTEEGYAVRQVMICH